MELQKMPNFELDHMIPKENLKKVYEKRILANLDVDLNALCTLLFGYENVVFVERSCCHDRRKRLVPALANFLDPLRR